MAGAGAVIHVVGSMMIDRVVRVQSLPRAGETVAARSSWVFAGGKGANQAAAAARCGARVRMLGRGGPDARFIVEALRDAGVRTGAISLEDEASGNATVMVAAGGENAIVIAPEANRRISRRDIEHFLAGGEQGDIVLFQNECSFLEEGIGAAAARGLRVWLNAAPADASLRELRFTKLAGLVVNETEAEALTGEADAARALEALAVRMPGGTVVVTLGAEGAIAAVGGARYAHRGYAVDAVDTVGCGDAFVGAYLAAIADGMDVVRALARANAAGALAAMREGAMPSLPSRAEIDVAARLPEGSRLKPRAGGGDGMPECCESCDYQLAGSRLHEPCPECGRVILPARFIRNWSRAHERRGFRLASEAYRATAVLWVAALAWIILEHYTVGVGISRWVLAASTVLLPLTMLAVAWRAVHSRGRLLAIAASVLRLVAPASVVAIGALGSGPVDWALRGVILAVVASDGLFAAMVPSLAIGTRVRGIPVQRIWGIRALAVVALVASVLQDVLPGPPTAIFALSAALVLWSAVEVSGIARRMRGLEQR